MHVIPVKFDNRLIYRKINIIFSSECSCNFRNMQIVFMLINYCCTLGKWHFE